MGGTGKHRVEPAARRCDLGLIPGGVFMGTKMGLVCLARKFAGAASGETARVFHNRNDWCIWRTGERPLLAARRDGHILTGSWIS